MVPNMTERDAYPILVRFLHTQGEVSSAQVLKLLFSEGVSESVLQVRKAMEVITGLGPSYVGRAPTVRQIACAIANVRGISYDGLVVHYLRPRGNSKPSTWIVMSDKEYDALSL